MDPTVFIEERLPSHDRSTGQYTIALDVGDEATIATVYLTVQEGTAERDAIAAELGRILDPDVMDDFIAAEKIEFEIKERNAPPDPHIFYKPHDLAFELMKATSSRGCISFISRSEWQASR